VDWTRVLEVGFGALAAAASLVAIYYAKRAVDAARRTIELELEARREQSVVREVRRYLAVLTALDDLSDGALRVSFGQPEFAFLHARQRLASTLAAVPTTDIPTALDLVGEASPGKAVEKGDAAFQEVHRVVMALRGDQAPQES
jgi:hypothetical protein